MKYDKLIFEQGTDKFVIGYYGSDLYWIMTNYHKNNKFIITKEHYKLYGFFKNFEDRGDKFKEYVIKYTAKQ